MPPKLTRRIGPVGVALTLFELWLRLPPNQRRLITEQVREHGPRLARKAAQAHRSRRS